MVTLAEIKQRQEELQRLKTSAEKVTKEKIPQRRFGSGVTREQQQQVLQRRQQARQVISQVASERKRLQDVRGQVLARQAEEARVSTFNRDVRLVNKILGGSAPQAAAATPQQKRLLREAKAGQRLEFKSLREIRQEQELGPPGAIGSALGGGFIFPESVVFQQSIRPGLDRPVIVREIPETPLSGQRRFEVEFIEQPQQVKTQERPTGVVSAVEKREGLEGIQQAISRERSKVARKESIKAQAIGAALGVAATGVSITQFTESLISKPITTIKGIPEGLRRTKETVTSGKLATIVKEEPGFVTGKVIGEVAAAKAISAAPRLTRFGLAKVSPKGRTPVATTSKLGVEKIIKDIPDIGGKGEIAIIPPGTPPTARIAKEVGVLEPSFRGGFGFSQIEQKAILKADISPAISAQAGFKAFEVPLERELFATPGIKGKGFVRESRLAIQKATAEDIFVGDVDLKLFQEKPAIFVFEDVGKFSRKVTPGTELEVIAKPGLIPVKERKVAVVPFKGRAVPVFKIRLEKASKAVEKSVEKATRGQRLTIKESLSLRKATGFRPSELSVPTRPTVAISPLAPTTTRFLKGSTRRRTPIRTPSIKITQIISPAKTPKLTIPKIPRITPPRTPPRIPSLTPPRTPPIRPPKRPPFRPPARPPARPPTRPPIIPPIRTPPIRPTNGDRILRPRRRKRRRGISDVALVQGFTARTLKLKPIKIKKADLPKAIVRFQTPGVRRTPIIVR